MNPFDPPDRLLDQERTRLAGRLPPGQSLTKQFPVLHYSPIPAFDPATWTLRIFGEVEQEVSWNWEEFDRLPRDEVTLDLHCVTHWSKMDTRWQGVPVRRLVEEGLIRVKPTSTHVLQHAEYGYTVNLPLEVVLQGNFLLATHYDGARLTPEHGYPLRAVIGAIPDQPDLVTPYLWKGAKWLRALQFMAGDQPGFWEQAGYNNRADVWKEERYA